MWDENAVTAETSKIGDFEFETGKLAEVIANRDNIVFEGGELDAYVDSGHAFMQTSDDMDAVEKVRSDMEAVGISFREPECGPEYQEEAAEHEGLVIV